MPAVLLWLIVLNAALPVGQTTTGEIAGTVRDTSGAVLPGVTITVTSDFTGISRVETTTGEGRYVVTGLPVGVYHVRAELQSFRPAEREGLEVTADGRLTVDFTLPVGTFMEAVEVEAAKGESANRASGEIARVVDGEQIRALALNGRNYMELASLIPGTAQLEDDWVNQTVSLSTAQQSINGNRGNNSTLTIDGAYNLDVGSQGTQINNVGIDFIDQVSIQTSNFSARFGRNAGAAINVVTKSGTNRYRGSLFEFYRDDRFDAPNHFAVKDASGRPIKAMLKFHNFGGSLGGPIVKRKMFFFGGIDRKRIDQETQPFRRTLPTLAELNGDFSARLAGPDGIVGTADDASLPDQLVDPITREPFPGNVIPADRITPEGRQFADLYRALIARTRQFTDTPIGNNATYQMAIPFDLEQVILRFDYQSTPSHRTNLRIIHDDTRVVRANANGTNSDNLLYRDLRSRPGSAYQLGHTWTASKAWLVEARVGASWHRQRYVPYDDTWRRDIYGLDLPQFYSAGGLLPAGVPNVSVAGFASVVGPNGLQISPSVDITPEGTVTWLKNRHTLIMGTRVTRVRKDQNAQSNYLGTWTFDSNGNTASTGYGLADMLVGRFRRYSEASADPVAFYRFTQPAAYISDTWRLRSNLSVEAGVRYEYMQPAYSAQNNLANFDPALYDPAQAVTLNRNGSIVPNSGNRFNGLIRAGSGVPADQQGRTSVLTGPEYDRIPVGAPRGFYSSYQVFMPRVSAAYSLNKSTVVRGGFGVFYDRPEINLVYQQARLPPFAGSLQVENASVRDPTDGRPTTAGVMGNIVAVDPHIKVPRQANYSVSVQRELPRGFFLEAAYVGNRGRHLLRTVDINAVPFNIAAANQALPTAERFATNALRPYKGYSQIQQRRSDARSNYHALQLYGTKRRGNATMTVSYTLGRVRTDANSLTDNRENALEEGFVYGPASFDRRQIFVWTYRYRLPFLAERRDLLARILAGWEVSGVTRYQTGAPLTIIGNTALGDRRADYLGGPIALPSDQRNEDRWFNTDAFTAAPDYRRGNALVGQVRGPELYTWNLSFRKRFPFVGPSKLSVQIDAFNLFNRVNLHDPQGKTTDPNYGKIASAGPARQLAFGVRCEF